MNRSRLHLAALPRLALCALLCAAAAGECAADGIATDRPDFVESSDVVGKGRLQVETGIAWERTRADGQASRVRTTPSLLRMGVDGALELRVETDGFASSRSRDDASGATLGERGFCDVSLGVKWRQREGEGARGLPAIAWLLHADLDTGSPAFRGAGIRPSLRAVVEWELPGAMSLGAMSGLAAERDDAGGRFAAGVLAVTFGKAWTPAWRTFVEIAGQRLASTAHGGSVVTFDAGAARLVTQDVQVDVSASRGISSAAPDLQWGIGLAVRF